MLKCAGWQQTFLVYHAVYGKTIKICILSPNNKNRPRLKLYCLHCLRPMLEYKSKNVKNAYPTMQECGQCGQLTNNGTVKAKMSQPRQNSILRDGKWKRILRIRKWVYRNVEYNSSIIWSEAHLKCWSALFLIELCYYRMNFWLLVYVLVLVSLLYVEVKINSDKCWWWLIYYDDAYMIVFRRSHYLRIDSWHRNCQLVQAILKNELYLALEHSTLNPLFIIYQSPKRNL